MVSRYLQAALIIPRGRSKRLLALLTGLLASLAPAIAAAEQAVSAAPQSGLALDTLSMGMSDDLEAAVLEGAHCLRIGSAIFGARSAAGVPA